MNGYKTETVEISSLSPHPRNYRVHPPDQISHLAESIKRHGFYRNAVVARDGTILAGHGTIIAAKSLGMTSVPVIRLDVGPNDAAALKVLTGDNQIAQLGVVVENSLAELLSEIGGRDASDASLLGTGFDALSLDRLICSIKGEVDAEKEWASMPEFAMEDATAKRRIVVNFKSDADAARFGEVVGQVVTSKTRSLWYPAAEIERYMDKRYGSKK